MTVRRMIRRAAWLVRWIRREYCRIGLHRWEAGRDARTILWVDLCLVVTGPVRCQDCLAERAGVADPGGRLLRLRESRERKRARPLSDPWTPGGQAPLNSQADVRPRERWCPLEDSNP